MEKEKIVALYVRVSTGYQVDKDSLPFQKQELQSYCKHVLHLENTEIFEDAGKSGKNTKRPGFERMMRRVAEGKISHVIVYKIDRISRNLVDFSQMYDTFKYHRVTFISLNEQFDTSSAIGEAVLKIILVFAELERKLTSERVKDIMIGRAQSGSWNGARVPYGWSWDDEKQTPVHSPEEATAARLIYELYDKTHSSGSVVRYLNDNDIPTKRGGEWTTKTVADFIRNPINKGDYRYNFRESAHGRKKPSEEVIYREAVFPPLVSPDLWNRCNAVMDRNGKLRNHEGMPHAAIHTHVFGGLFYCGICGSAFQVQRKDRPRSNGFRPTIYQCGKRNRKAACPAPGVSEVTAGPFCFNLIANIVSVSKQRGKIRTVEALEYALLSGPEFSSVACIEKKCLEDLFSLLCGRYVATVRGSSYLPSPLAPSRSGSDTEKLSQEKAKLERALDRLKNAYLFDDNAMDEKEYLSTRAQLSERLVSVNNQIAEASMEEAGSESDNASFISSASSFLLSYHLQAGNHIEYRDLAASVDETVLFDFLHLVIDKIIVRERNISSIFFKSGMEIKFIYKNA